MNWKAGALYHLTENGNVYINYAVSQQPPGGNNFALAQSGSGNSANRTDFKPQKPTPARLAPNGRFWINACCSPPRCSVLISKMKLSKMTTGLTRNTVRNASKAMRFPLPGISPRMAGDWRLYPAKATIKNGKDVARDGSSSLPYTPEHAFTLWSQYQATDDISVGAGARYIGSMHKGSDGAVGTPAFTEGYWVADAKLGYRVNRNLDFQLNVYNLFDTNYVASINKSGYRYHPGAPRTFLLTANMHF